MRNILVRTNFSLSSLSCRDAVFRVLAVEQPQAVVLNYAPGPLDTPMITELLADQRTDPGELRISGPGAEFYHDLYCSCQNYV